MKSYALAIPLSILLCLQLLTVGVSLAVNDESMLNQYGSTQATTYPDIDLQWAPTKPTTGQDVQFKITFKNASSSMPKSHIDYTFTITKNGNNVYSVSQHTHSGIDTIKQKFDTEGDYKVTVTITGIDFKSVTPRSSDFSLTVEKPVTQEQNQQPPKESKKEEPKPMMKEEHPMKPAKGEERHMKHLAEQAPMTAPYMASMNYTLAANGKGTSISDNSTSADVTLSMKLSVWKSTEGIVSMDLMSGMIKIGENETHDILAGNALYLIKAHRMVVFGFITEDHGIKPLKLKAMVSSDTKLPATKSTNSMQLDILSPQSKLSSKWFLNMHGEVKLS